MNQVATISDQELPQKMGEMKAGGAIQAIVPQNMEDAYRLAKMVAASNLAPKDMKSVEAITVAILHGLEIGIKPMMALQRIAVINGRPALWGDAVLALVRSSGLLESIKESIDGKGNEMRAVCEVKRRGEERTFREFSVAAAIRAGLWNNKDGPWKTYPERMLQMRARAYALRDVFPDVLGGMYVAEELQDEQPMRDVTPPAAPPPAPPPAAAVTPQATVIPPAPSKAADASPKRTEAIDVPVVVASQPIVAESSMSYDERIADWESRLKTASRNEQEEIFEAEIEPFKETGAMFPPDYNRLIALVKEA